MTGDFATLAWSLQNHGLSMASGLGNQSRDAVVARLNNIKQARRETKVSGADRFCVVEELRGCGLARIKCSS